MADKKIEMIEEFQCPGCVCGGGTDEANGCFKPSESHPGWDTFSCDAHMPGTMIMGLGSIYLGLPKGFNRVGMRSESAFRKAKNPGECHNIRFWLKGADPQYDNLNVPVWAMEKDGYLFVRTYMPRINDTKIDVIEGGTLDMVPGALNVAEFIEEID